MRSPKTIKHTAAEPRRTIVPQATSATPVEHALALGAHAVGRSLVFTPAGTLSDADGGPSPFLPSVAFLAACDVLGSKGERLGSVRAMDLTSTELSTDEREALGRVAALVGADVSAAARIGRFDHVTGLPNRRQFEADVTSEAQGAPPQILTLVTLADARHYNEVLRALGHSCAEGFVRSGVSVLRSIIGSDVRLYHVSVLSVAFLTDATVEHAEARAREIVAAFAKPVPSEGINVSTRIGVGMTRFDPANTRTAEALRSALAGAQDSRRLTKGYAFYDKRSDEAHIRAFRLIADLEAALRSGDQLALAYQPRIGLSTGDVVGAEGLIRWNHPELGAISPAEFIPLAETTSLIEPLTDWVVERGVEQWAAWRRAGLAGKLSLNIAPSVLHHDNFLTRVEGVLNGAALDPRHLELEVTEGTLTSSEAGVRGRIDHLRAIGMTIAIDDFGTGYSNLDYLTRLPADVLKIDRGFIQPLDGAPRHRKLVRALIELAHDLDFSVVAEGVETETVYGQLKDWGCEEGQGFYMSRPLASADFAAFARI